MAPKSKKGKSKSKRPKPKLKATPTSMKPPHPRSPKDERKERGVNPEEEEGSLMHLEEEEDRGIKLDEEHEEGVELDEEQEEEGVELDEEQERKIEAPTVEESPQARTEGVKEHLHTPIIPKWGQGKSFVDVVSHGSDEKEAMADHLKRASRSVQSELLRPKVAKPTSPYSPGQSELLRPKVAKPTSPYSPGHTNPASQGSWLSREKTSEERYVEHLAIQRRADEDLAKAKEERKMKAGMALEPLLSLAEDFLRSFRKPGEETLSCSMDYSWLKPVLIKFLIDQGMTESESEKVELLFKNCPGRIQTINEFMQNREAIAREVKLLQGARTVYVAAALGRTGFKAHVEAIFSKHDEDITFNGSFTLDDLIILDEEKVVILADPFVPEKTQGNPFGIALSEHKCNDVKQIWKLVSPFYTRKDAKGNDELPLHFDDLEKEMMKVKEEEVSTEKYRKLIRSCFGLASCMAKVLFCQEVYRITRKFGIGADPALREVFATLPAELVDWKMDSVDSSINAIRMVALFGDGTSRFSNNRYGCLELDRHILQHGGEHSRLNDMDELELLTSSQFKGLLHAVLKAMIYDGKPCGKYASLLSAYTTLAKYDKQDLPTGS